MKKLILLIAFLTLVASCTETKYSDVKQEKAEVVPRYVLIEGCFSQAKVRVIPNAHLEPTGEIETRPMLYADTKPEGRHGAVMRYKQGTTGVTMKDGKIVTKDIPRLPERPTTARNASPALKRTLAKMINEKFKYSPERRAQREFHRALDMMIA